jgi:hypothetical protein
MGAGGNISTWCRPISLLVPRTYTSEGWYDTCYEGLGGYYVQWNAVWRITRPDTVTLGFNTKALSKGEYEPIPGCDGLHIHPLELIGVTVNVVLDVEWATTVSSRQGGISSRSGHTIHPRCHG